MYTKGTHKGINLNEEGCYRLILAIIYNAFEDALISNQNIENSPTEAIKLRKIKNKKSAINFFHSVYFTDYCDLINLNPDYLRSLLRVEFKKRSKNNGRNPIQ